MRRTRKSFIVAAIWLLATAGSLAADDHDGAEIRALRAFYVDAWGGSDDGDGLSPGRPFATIQKAISTATGGEEIFVFAGIYREILDLQGKALTIRGVAGPLGVPIIEAPRQAAIQMLSGEGADTVLQNLVVRNSLIGVTLVNSSPTVRNLTIVGCGIGLLALGESEPVVNSCIFWDNTSEDLSGAEARYCCLQAREEPATLTNIYRNPLFADPEGGDYHLQSSGGRYVLAWDMFIPDVQTSPCVGAVDPDGDANAEPLPNGGRVNMGAYGGTFYASLSSPNLRPTVSITGWGARPNSLRLTVDAQDPDGEVVRVEFYADGVKVAEDDDGRDGWFAEWPTEEGTFDLVAVAEDNEGARTLSETHSQSSYQGGGRTR